MDDRSLHGQTALVTGAASGLGAHVAYDLAKAGAVVGVLDWNLDALAEVTQRILAAGGQARTVLADLADRRDVTVATERFTGDLSRLDILVACATALPDRPLLEMDLAGWRMLTALNVGATLAATAAATPVMARQGYGRVVHLDASLAYHQLGLDHELDHGLGDAALAPLTRSFALRLSWSGVTVNCVAPGALQPGLEGALRGLPASAHLLSGSAGSPEPVIVAERARSRAELTGAVADAVLGPRASYPASRRLALATPARRWTSAEDVAAAVRFLVSADAGFVSGQVFHVRGAAGSIPAPRGDGPPGTGTA